MRVSDAAARRALGRCAACTLALALALAIACACVLAVSVPAWAYFVFGTVEVSTGASSLSVEAGKSVSTSVLVTPASDDQTLGCGMAKCPQSCTTPDAIEAGYTCFDVNGNCTCAGTEYSTYYPEVRVSSSNSAIATASVSGGTLVVTGNSAGEAIITVSASLRQWTSNTTAISVTVTGAKDVAGISPAHDAEVEVPQEAVVGASVDDAVNERVIDTVAGRVYAVEINAYLDTAEYLSLIAGTDDQVVFWAGASYEGPDYSWTFSGDAVDGSSPYASFDPSVEVSDVGSGEVANIMMRAQDGVVLAFSHGGWLPGEASVYVRVKGLYADGTKLKLFCYNESARAFELADENLTVAGGYTSFRIDHCSTWALSTDDLTAYAVEETNTPRALAAASIGQDGGGLVVGIACAAAVGAAALVALLAFAIRRRRRVRKAGLQREGEAKE